MAKDHRGNPLHAGKRTNDDDFGRPNDAFGRQIDQGNRSYEESNPWDFKYTVKKMDGANLHTPSNPMPYETQKLQFKLNTIPSTIRRGITYRTERRMTRNMSFDPDTAHINLSTDEYY